jgi:hypothetical protein
MVMKCLYLIKLIKFLDDYLKALLLVYFTNCSFRSSRLAYLPIKQPMFGFGGQKEE